MHTLTLTPYAASLLSRKESPNQDEEIGTAEAARLAGLSQRRIIAWCDEGRLVEGVDWRRPAASSHNKASNGLRGGNYKIKKSSVLRLAGIAQ